MPTTVVRVEALRKAYGSVVAVNDVSFEVSEGEIFGVVGPNGAGKTTLIECLEGLRKPGSGRLEVLGLDPTRHHRQLSQRIGTQLQQSAVPQRLRVREALDLFGSFYAKSLDPGGLLDQLNLTDKADAPFAKLSGGQKQRLFIALALINDPEILFLDELTTGLDPQARRAMWDLVLGLRTSGKTVVLTTHFMEEAERLCDRVAVIDHGRIVVLDSPDNLIRGLGSNMRVVFNADSAFKPDQLAGVSGVTRIERSGEQVTVWGEGDSLVLNVVTALGSMGCQFRDLNTQQPSLEDVFLALTGREIRD